MLEEYEDKLRALKAAGGIPRVPDGPKLEPGAFDSRISVLRQRLAATEPAVPESMPGYESVYDPMLQAALERFQRGHGLNPDGQIGKATLRALNRPLDERIRQVQAAIRRRQRTLAAEQKQANGAVFRINIPAFEAELLENGEAKLRMRVVVGTRYKRTPVFSSRVTQITLNPTWTVPQSLTEEELLPKLRRDASKVAADGFEAIRDGASVPVTDVDWKAVPNRGVPYVLRQAAGPKNPLGRVIFHMPNQHDVYLHDTNARYLFASDLRASSHGCIRLQKPMDLLAYLLEGDRTWTKAKIREAIDSGETVKIPVARKLFVELVYESVWVDDTGALQIREDLYGQDLEDEPATNTSAALR